MTTIHPSAVVDTAAILDPTVVVGPFCFIGADVEIGANTRLGPGVMIHGPTKIGTGNNFYGQASIGGDSQAKAGAAGKLLIGDNNTVREYVTISRATTATGCTTIGNGNWLMACCHVAHDCTIGDDSVIANAVLLAGLVTISNKATLGGMSAYHQHCRIGELAIVGGATVVRQDVPPYAKFAQDGKRVVVDINTIGLERAGLSEHLTVIKEAFAILYHQGLRLDEATQQLHEFAAKHAIVAPLAEFVAQESKYGLVRPRR